MTDGGGAFWSGSPGTESHTGFVPVMPRLALPPLEWFVRLRWVFIAGATALLALERLVAPDARRPVQLGVLLAALLVVNVVWREVAERIRRAGGNGNSAEYDQRRLAWFANSQLAVDLLFLTLILHYAGGLDNPLSVFYVFHAAIAALLLPARQAVAQAGWAMLLYAGMVGGEVQGWLAPRYPLLGTLAPGAAAPTSIRAVFQLAATGCGVFGSLYFTLHLVHRLHAREAELERINAALRRSQTAIAHIQQRRSRFMQTAAHQLKSPLATIQTLAGLIRDGLVAGEAARQTAERIVRRCRGGIEQVTELLTLARVQDADPVRHRRSAADVGAVVEEVCRRYAPLAADKQLCFDCRVERDRPLEARVEARDLSDCVANLVDNAIKYTQCGGTVRVWVHRCDGPPLLRPGDPPRIAVHVADTGMGIEPAVLQSPDGSGGAIFDAYRRGNNALAAGIPGSGLGLAIVRVVLEQAGGRMLVRSKVGEGTHFTALLPPADEPAAELPVRDTCAVQVEPPDNLLALITVRAPESRIPAGAETGEPAHA